MSGAKIGCRGRGDAIPLLDKDPPASMEERKEQKEVWDKEMKELISAYSKFKELKKPLTYIRKEWVNEAAIRLIVSMCSSKRSSAHSGQ